MSNLRNLTISSDKISKTKYFFGNRPWVRGKISDSINGVIVSFDNIGNKDDYFVAVSQKYPSKNFTTENDCFSSLINSNICQKNIPDGDYIVSVMASKDLYSEPERYLFPKLLHVDYHQKINEVNQNLLVLLYVSGILCLTTWTLYLTKITKIRNSKHQIRNKSE